MHFPITCETNEISGKKLSKLPHSLILSEFFFLFVLKHLTYETTSGKANLIFSLWFKKSCSSCSAHLLSQQQEALVAEADRLVQGQQVSLEGLNSSVS